MRARCSGSMPTPVSLTASSTHPAARDARRHPHLVRRGPAFRHRLNRVDDEVQHHLGELVLLPRDGRRVAEVEDEARARPRLRFRHASRGVDRLAEVHRPGRRAPVALAERAQPAHNLADPPGALARLLQRLDVVGALAPDGGIGRRRRVLQELEVRDEERERVVDLVGHAGRERADGRQPVGEHELGLESLLLRLGALSIADVPVHRHEPDHLARGAPHRHGGDLEVDGRAHPFARGGPPSRNGPSAQSRPRSGARSPRGARRRAARERACRPPPPPGSRRCAARRRPRR